MKYLCISGSRDITPGSAEANEIHRLVLAHDAARTIVVHGGAKGADEEAHFAAKGGGYDERVFHARWATLGKAAGQERNGRMARWLALNAAKVNSTVEVHCFYLSGALNIGTANMHAQSKKLGLTVFEHGSR